MGEAVVALDQIDHSALPSLADPFGSLGFPDDFPSDLASPNFLSGLGLDGDVEFSIDDLLDFADIDGDPTPEAGDAVVVNCTDAKDGSGVCSSNDDVGRTGSPVSGNSGSCSVENSGNYAVQSPDSGSNSGTAEVKMDDGEERKAWGSKRKERTSGDENSDPNPTGKTQSRSSKSRRSGSSEEKSSPCVVESEEDEKRKSRLIRNRESAQLSRQRKKHYVEELEDKVKIMNSTISDLNGRIAYFMAENASLRQQMGSNGGACPPPMVYPGIAPMGPMHYPWIPCVKPPGSQVPLIPIPRLRTQQPVSTTKSKKPDVKKPESKRKKVASVSLLGLLSLILLMGVLFPVLDSGYGGYEHVVSDGHFDGRSGMLGQSRGQILSVMKNFRRPKLTNKAAFKKEIHNFPNSNRARSRVEGNVNQKEVNSQPSATIGGSSNSVNKSEPLLASLYVPRNDKLVKIDGNLIISSVIASERVVSDTGSELENSKTSPSEKVGKKMRVAIARSMSSALAVPSSERESRRHSHMYRTSGEHQKALPLGSEKTYYANTNTNPHDRPVNEWFREGLEGPVFSSGMCTEVFQFDAAPMSGFQSGIVPSASVANTSNLQTHNSTDSVNIKNRRILYSHKIPLNGSTLNSSKEGYSRPPENTSYRSTKPAKSMVVSILVDPREAGDGNVDGMMRPRSISRIFVVVLVDSVKYITYSCTLPFKSNAPHLVT